MKIWLEDRFPEEDITFDEPIEIEDFFEVEEDEDCTEYCGYHPHNSTLSRNEILRTIQ